MTDPTPNPAPTTFEPVPETRRLASALFAGDNSDGLSYRSQRILDLYRWGEEESFKDHEVTEIGPGHWHFAEPGSSVYAVHVCIGHGAVVLWGDLDTVGWQYGPSEPMEALSWVSRMAGSYLMEKAGIFAGGRSKILTFDSKAWEEDLVGFKQELIEYADENYEDDASVNAAFLSAVEEAFEDLDADFTPDEAYRHLSDRLESTHFLSDLWDFPVPEGLVPASRIIWAHCAVRALYAKLLAAEPVEPAEPLKQPSPYSGG